MEKSPVVDQPKLNREQREYIMGKIKEACRQCGFSEVEITEDSSPPQDAREGNGADNTNLTTAVYEVDFHCDGCDGCTKKVEHAVKACDGVEDCMVDCKSNTVTLVFGKVDPDKIKQKLEKNIAKKVQLLSVKSGAPAVSGDDKEDKTKQINERETEEKTKENDVALPVPKEEEVKMYVKLACCLKIEAKPNAMKREGAGDSEIGGGDGDVKPWNPNSLIYSSESPGTYGGLPFVPQPQMSDYGNSHSYPYPYPFPNPPNPKPSAPPAPGYYCQAYPLAKNPSRPM